MRKNQLLLIPSSPETLKKYLNPNENVVYFGHASERVGLLSRPRYISITDEGRLLILQKASTKKDPLDLSTLSFQSSHSGFSSQKSTPKIESKSNHKPESVVDGQDNVYLTTDSRLKSFLVIQNVIYIHVAL
eukprot:NODE_265_length_11346_cov_0.635814.p8 type:complete len:132 gc:universal NODE_265_length_11346_cov_0.635814:436-831(+)